MNNEIGFCRIWQRVSIYTNSVTNDIPYSDEESYIEKVHVPSNAHECKHLFPLLEGLSKGTTVYADKGYDSADNRQHLEEHSLQDDIMYQAHCSRPLMEAQTKRNRYLLETGYVAEDTTPKFRYAWAAYFGLRKAI